MLDASATGPRVRPLRPQRSAVRPWRWSKISEVTPVRLTVAIEAARVHAASGNDADVAEAANVLKNAIADATREGLTGQLLQARLALGEVDLSSGNRAAGRLLLLAVQREATAKVF